MSVTLYLCVYSLHSIFIHSCLWPSMYTFIFMTDIIHSHVHDAVYIHDKVYSCTCIFVAQHVDSVTHSCHTARVGGICALTVPFVVCKTSGLDLLSKCLSSADGDLSAFSALHVSEGVGVCCGLVPRPPLACCSQTA